MDNSSVRVPTRRFTTITRVPANTSLLSTGVLVEKIDSTMPTLYDCLITILEPQMYKSKWVELIENIPSYSGTRKGSCVFILSEQAQSYYNCLISNVRTETERTISTQLIYTDDEEFNVRTLPRITKQSQFDDVEKGLISYIQPDKTYAIKTTTCFKSGPNLSKSETIIDYLFYIPSDSITKEDTR